MRLGISEIPAGLGTPATAGAQNQMRYAYFPSTSRLAIQIGGVVTLYDTADHSITGVSQCSYHRPRTSHSPVKTARYISTNCE